jgi:JmjC domain, hydroxylase/Zinc-finger domain of monoamine-oxidase A repressor R1
MAIKEYLEAQYTNTDKINADNYKEVDRWYLKDIDVPEQWQIELKKNIPGSIFYLNDNIRDPECAVPGEDYDLPPGQQSNARAGDLMSSLPEEMRAENLMCYIGHEGTYTPAHREMCASLGHNIMVECSTSHEPNGRPTRHGSSIWFMTEYDQRKNVSEYWLSSLGHDIEVETHFASLESWIDAPFNTYIVEQKEGDMVLIPPLAPHQVWNRGTRTVKVAWNRTTVETLELALQAPENALARTRLVCRDEQYKNKAIVHYTLGKYTDRLHNIGFGPGGIPRPIDTMTERGNLAEDLKSDFEKLFRLYYGILLDEAFNPEAVEENVEFIPYDSNITCSFCRCNIFNRFLTCKNCIEKDHTGDDNTYDICMDCYSMGRSCACVSGLSWAEQWKWDSLLEKHEEWRVIVVAISNQKLEAGHQADDLPQEFKGVWEDTSAERSLAWVCQEELSRRPFEDANEPRLKPILKVTNAEEVASGKKKRRTFERTDEEKRETASCHTCKVRHPKYQVATCSLCIKSFCYGILHRAFDEMPLSHQQFPQSWVCPICRNICSCAGCRAKGITVPYVPKGTFIGIDSKSFSDPRSVEVLVDFRCSNTRWKEDGPLRQQLKNEAALRNEGDPDGYDGEDVDGNHELDIEFPQDSTPNGLILNAPSGSWRSPGLFDERNPLSHSDTLNSFSNNSMNYEARLTENSSLHASNQAPNTYESSVTSFGNWTSENAVPGYGEPRPVSELERDPRSFYQAAGLGDHSMAGDGFGQSQNSFIDPSLLSHSQSGMNRK